MDTPQICFNVHKTIFPNRGGNDIVIMYFLSSFVSSLDFKLFVPIQSNSGVENGFSNWFFLFEKYLYRFLVLDILPAQIENNLFERH